jgi:RloB-like protein
VARRIKRDVGRGRGTSAAAFRRRSILVFTEGSKTEPMYLMHWQRLHRDRVSVAFDTFHGAPMQLVERAAARRAVDLGRVPHRAVYDEYWCVFDVDEHPNVRRALDLAASNGIGVAVTNPCIEAWFLLHFQDRGAAIDRGDAQRKSSVLLGCGKSPTPEALTGLVCRYEEARCRAWALDNKHALDGSPPRSNPSSGIWRLIDRIRAAPPIDVGAFVNARVEGFLDVATSGSSTRPPSATRPA